MCGFIGIVNSKHLKRSEELDTKFNRAYSFLKSRGPDEKGTWVSKNCYFLHTRLKILDLSSSSAQPMEKNNNTICFNGEIYNFNELKEKLILKGYRFNSNGDTEVLLSAWREWGEGMMEKLDGMFSMAIWNNEEKTLFLARDRFGKKPLVYSIKNNIIYFSSDVKSLSCITDGGGIDKESIKSLFRFRFIHEPRTIFNNFKKLAPGNILKFNQYGVKITNWYNLNKNKHSFKKNDNKKLKSLIVKAVEKRLISDVPIGVFLSGGIDSAIIIDSLSQIDKKVPTFTIGFKGEASYYNESDNAKKIANYYGFKNETIYLNSRNILDKINNILEASDEPFADSSTIPTYMISNAVKDDIKVALTGDGGDELFGGYRKYSAYRWLSITKYIPSFCKVLIASLLPDSKNTKISNQARKLKRLLENSNIDIEKMQINFLDQTSSNEYYQLFKEKKKDIYTEGLMEADKFGSDLNKVLARDFNFSLLGDMLVKLDRCSMANSLELRSPFLDKDLVDFSFNIPGKEKIGFFSGKKILKNCYESQLPKWYLTLPKKGFEVPLQKWLQNDLKYLVEEATEKKVLDSLDIKNPNIIFQWKNDFLNGKKDNSWKLWTLISYAYWAKNLKVI